MKSPLNDLALNALKRAAFDIETVAHMCGRERALLPIATRLRQELVQEENVARYHKGAATSSEECVPHFVLDGTQTGRITQAKVDGGNPTVVQLAGRKKGK